MEKPYAMVGVSIFQKDGNATHRIWYINVADAEIFAELYTRRFQTPPIELIMPADDMRKVAEAGLSSTILFPDDQ